MSVSYGGQAVLEGVMMRGPAVWSVAVRTPNGEIAEVTKSELHVEVCSHCHPFYTGKQKLMDAGGRVERFQRRLEKAGGPRRG